MPPQRPIEQQGRAPQSHRFKGGLRADGRIRTGQLPNRKLLPYFYTEYEACAHAAGRLRPWECGQAQFLPFSGDSHPKYRRMADRPGRKAERMRARGMELTNRGIPSRELNVVLGSPQPDRRLPIRVPIQRNFRVVTSRRLMMPGPARAPEARVLRKAHPSGTAHPAPRLLRVSTERQRCLTRARVDIPADSARPSASGCWGPADGGLGKRRRGDGRWAKDKGQGKGVPP